MPIEYKRGRPKSHDADRVQLCAQALCLEEMFGVTIPAGEIFYGKTRRRVRVEFDDALRATTRSAVERLREIILAGRTPPAEPGPKCRHCSLNEICLPKLAERRRTVSQYIRRSISESLRDSSPDRPEETPPL